mmetsp:Transcript_42516/g.68414  ORF Transcript_42516/g.68414 Transcript_42516/m.68414 type:complete len:977 (+) Transcript_42516:2-2932(+)
MAAMVDNANGIYTHLASSSNREQLIHLTGPFAMVHLHVLRERYLNGSSYYPDGNPKVWLQELEETWQRYYDLFPVLYKEWLSWRVEQFAGDDGRHDWVSGRDCPKEFCSPRGFQEINIRESIALIASVLSPTFYYHKLIPERIEEPAILNIPDILAIKLGPYSQYTLNETMKMEGDGLIGYKTPYTYRASVDPIQNYQLQYGLDPCVHGSGVDGSRYFQDIHFITCDDINGRDTTPSYFAMHYWGGGLRSLDTYAYSSHVERDIIASSSAYGPVGPDELCDNNAWSGNYNFHGYKTAPVPGGFRLTSLQYGLSDIRQKCKYGKVHFIDDWPEVKSTDRGVNGIMFGSSFVGFLEDDLGIADPLVSPVGLSGISLEKRASLTSDYVYRWSGEFSGEMDVNVPRDYIPALTSEENALLPYQSRKLYGIKGIAVNKKNLNLLYGASGIDACFSYVEAADGWIGIKSGLTSTSMNCPYGMVVTSVLCLDSSCLAKRFMCSELRACELSGGSITVTGDANVICGGTSVVIGIECSTPTCDKGITLQCREITAYYRGLKGPQVPQNGTVSIFYSVDAGIVGYGLMCDTTTTVLDGQPMDKWISAGTSGIFLTKFDDFYGTICKSAWVKDSRDDMISRLSGSSICYSSDYSLCCSSTLDSSSCVGSSPLVLSNAVNTTVPLNLFVDYSGKKAQTFEVSTNTWFVPPSNLRKYNTLQIGDDTIKTCKSVWLLDNVPRPFVYDRFDVHFDGFCCSTTLDSEPCGYTSVVRGLNIPTYENHIPMALSKGEATEETLFLQPKDVWINASNIQGDYYLSVGDFYQSQCSSIWWLDSRDLQYTFPATSIYSKKTNAGFYLCCATTPTPESCEQISEFQLQPDNATTFPLALSDNCDGEQRVFEHPKNTWIVYDVSYTGPENFQDMMVADYYSSVCKSLWSRRPGGKKAYPVEDNCVPTEYEDRFCCSTEEDATPCQGEMVFDFGNETDF